ncbi:unnamed protein product, partial [Choristocarpus tenellus]
MKWGYSVGRQGVCVLAVLLTHGRFGPMLSNALLWNYQHSSLGSRDPAGRLLPPKSCEAVSRKKKIQRGMSMEFMEGDDSQLNNRVARLEQIVLEQYEEVKTLRAAVDEAQMIIAIQSAIDSRLLEATMDTEWHSKEFDPCIIHNAEKLLRKRQELLQRWNLNMRFSDGYAEPLPKTRRTV